jgi:hypothetical protein
MAGGAVVHGTVRTKRFLADRPVDCHPEPATSAENLMA